MVKKNNKVLYISIVSISVIVIGIVIWGFLTDWKFWNHKQEKKTDPPKLPEYKLKVPIQKNTTKIQIDEPEKKGFKIGQQIQFGTGNKSETKTIVGFGSLMLILDSPIQFDHPKGTVIRVIKQAPEVPICKPGFFININKNNCEPCPNPPKNAAHTKKNSCDWACNYGYKKVYDSVAAKTTCEKSGTNDELKHIGNKCNTYPADGTFSVNLDQRLTQCKDWIKNNRTKDGEKSELCAHNGVLKSLAAYKTETGTDCPPFDIQKETGKVILQPLEYANLPGRDIVLWTDQNNCYPCVSNDQDSKKNEIHPGLQGTYNKYSLGTTEAALVIKDPATFYNQGISYKDYLEKL